MSLATRAAEYASAMASAHVMGGNVFSVEDANIWSDEAIDFAWNVRWWNASNPVLTWAEAAARLMNGEY